MSLHESLTDAHTIHNASFEFTTVANMEAATGLSAADEGKVARVGSAAPYKYFILTDYSTPVWEKLALPQHSTANVSSPPTDAELDSEFGTPAEAGDGFMAIVDDNDADSSVYIVVSNGTSWWYVALTKAV